MLGERERELQNRLASKAHVIQRKAEINEEEFQYEKIITFFHKYHLNVNTFLLQWVLCVFALGLFYW